MTLSATLAAIVTLAAWVIDMVRASQIVACEPTLSCAVTR